MPLAQMRGRAGASAVPSPVTVGSVTPAVGSTTGGTPISIPGTRFHSGATVTVGGAAATSVVVVSATEITCVTPAGTVGARDIVVTTALAPNGVTLSEGFLYQAGGAQTISGSVVLEGTSTAVGGGSVELWNSDGSALLDSVAVHATLGTYTISDVPNGTYHVMLHPAISHSLASVESGAISGTPSSAPTVVVSGGNQTQNYEVVIALFDDDYTGYSSTANFVSTWPDGGEISDPCYNVGVPPNSYVSWEATGNEAETGPAVRYTAPSRPASGCDADIQLRTVMRFNPAKSGATWYLRWREKMSNPWQNGSTSCGGHWEYKFLRFTAGGNAAVYEILLPYGQVGNPLKFNLTIVDSTNQSDSNAAQGNMVTLGAQDAWPGTWRTFVLQVTGHGTSSAAMKLYVDGTLLLSLSSVKSWVFNNNSFVFLEMGANLDSGPDQSGQTRTIERLTIYNTRPSLL